MSDTKFVLLTDIEDGSVLIQIGCIASVDQVGTDKCEVELTTDTVYTVKGKVEMIHTRIREANGS